MTKRQAATQIAKADKPARRVPDFAFDEAGTVHVHVKEHGQIRKLYGLKTQKAAEGVLQCALNGLGKSGEGYRDLMVAMAVEMEPQDAIEAMLVSQMTATHAAMMQAAGRLTDTDMILKMEAYDRTMNRLARTFTTQVETLKRYRAKANQVVRVERVTVESGGQAVVGHVQGGGSDDKNER